MSEIWTPHSNPPALGLYRMTRGLFILPTSVVWSCKAANKGRKKFFKKTRIVKIKVHCLHSHVFVWLFVEICYKIIWYTWILTSPDCQLISRPTHKGEDFCSMLWGNMTNHHHFVSTPTKNSKAEVLIWLWNVCNNLPTSSAIVTLSPAMGVIL